MVTVIAVIGLVMPSAFGEDDFITTPFSYHPDGWTLTSTDMEVVDGILSPYDSTYVGFYELDVVGDVREFVDDAWTLDLMIETERKFCNQREYSGDGLKCSNFNENVGKQSWKGFEIYPDRIYEIDGYRTLTIFYSYSLQLDESNDSMLVPFVGSTTNIYGKNHGITQIISESEKDMYVEHAHSIEKIIQSYTVNISLSEQEYWEKKYKQDTSLRAAESKAEAAAKAEAAGKAKAEAAAKAKAEAAAKAKESLDFSNQDLRYADFYHRNLSGANFTGADLSYADLRYADLSYADLSNAKLIRAKLFQADLSNANLENTNFKGASLPNKEPTPQEAYRPNSMKIHKSPVPLADQNYGKVSQETIDSIYARQNQEKIDNAVQLNNFIKAGTDDVKKESFEPHKNRAVITNYESVESFEPHKNRGVIINYQPLESNWKPADVPNSFSPSKLKLDTSHSSEFKSLVNKAKSAPMISVPKPMNDKIYPNKSVDRIVPNIGKDLVLYDKYGYAP